MLCMLVKREAPLERRLPYLSEPSFADDLFDLKVGHVDSIGVRLRLCVAHVAGYTRKGEGQQVRHRILFRQLLDFHTLYLLEA